MAPGTLPCNHTMAVDEMSRALELMTQLRALLLPLPPTDRWSELLRDLSDDILRSFTVVLSELRPRSNGKRMNPEERDMNDGHKKRRKLDSWTSFTSVPHVDGHQWTKYGQKQINNAKFPRSYYRCVHHKDQGCPATKRVQQKDDKDPPKFDVTYSMQHTCKTIETGGSFFVMDSAPKETSLFVLESGSSQQQEDPSMPSLVAVQNKDQDESSTFTNFEFKEVQFSELVTPVDTPGMEAAVIPNILSPLDSWDFDVEL